MTSYGHNGVYDQFEASITWADEELTEFQCNWQSHHRLILEQYAHF